ncbi:hypothetical protein DI005_20735 [Prauserella sp. PE36]|nr:hypothetical protein DI005_20735 [Prauserella sp. PE36]
MCIDVLMPYPQPTLAEKLDQLGTHLSEAMRWSRVMASDEPADDERSLALGEVRELLLQARRVYLMRLDGTR